MERPPDSEIMAFIGDGKKLSSEIYGHFGCRTTSDRCLVLRALNSLVRYKFLNRKKTFENKYIYWKA